MAQSTRTESPPLNPKVLTGERDQLSDLTDVKDHCIRDPQCGGGGSECKRGLPNGIVSISKKECSCDVDSCLSDQRKTATDTTKLSLPEASCHESVKKQGSFSEADSGVQSGTDNGSDTKSSSSSPGLSTESSVHDLSDKSDLKKCQSQEPLTVEESEKNVTNEQVDKLADSLSKHTSLHDIDSSASDRDTENGIEYVVYESEVQMPDIMRLITKDLSEPYSIYTYRYFIHNWPKLCFLAMEAGECVGAIVCKLDMHKKMVRRGYIAMLAVDQNCRRKRIGSHLVLKAIRTMIADDCDEVVLETEITNKAALRLYENLGFVRDKRLFRYYLNGVDALRLKLWLR